MPYYTKILLPDEQVRAIGRLHWVIFLRGWIWLLIAAAAGVAALQLGGARVSDSGTAGYAGPVTLAVAAIALVFSLVAFLSAWARRATTEIVVTDRRILLKQGFLRRRTMEMNMNKVETVDVVQSIAGRLFNYGTVMIRGVGSSYEPLRLIGNPLTLRTAIVAQ